MIKPVLFITFLLLSCNPPHKNQEPIILQPLSPYHYVFNSAGKDNRNDYFFSPAVISYDTAFATRLKKAAIDKIKPGSGRHLYSVYLYRQTARLNAQFRGSRDELKGIYDKDLFAYLRWTDGQLEVFYLLKDGQVVFDGLERKPLDQPFEFD